MEQKEPIIRLDHLGKEFHTVNGTVKALEDINLDIYAGEIFVEKEGKISEYSKTVGKKRTRIYYHIEPSGMEYLAEMRQSYQKVIDGMNRVFAAHEINIADDYEHLEN